jgi:hydrogenase maturation protein HypF
VTVDDPVRLQVRCRGTVQGVGFRPAIHRIATSLGLTGWVINDPQGATLEIEGPAHVVDEFLDRLQTDLPPLARLDKIEREECEPIGEEDFEVRTSTLGRREGALVPPDAILCADCRREMDDELDRRYHYPFTTCTNCGPRFTLVRSLPYDRERTSMGCFPLCVDCEHEYTDTADRRFHAEPVACPACGPRLWLADGEGKELESVDDPVSTAREELMRARWLSARLSSRLVGSGDQASPAQAEVRQTVRGHGAGPRCSKTHRGSRRRCRVPADFSEGADHARSEAR